jgi:hypothetical protein
MIGSQHCHSVSLNVGEQVDSMPCKTTFGARVTRRIGTCECKRLAEHIHYSITSTYDAITKKIAFEGAVARIPHKLGIHVCAAVKKCHNHIP